MISKFWALDIGCLVPFAEMRKDMGVAGGAESLSLKCLVEMQLEMPNKQMEMRI